MNKSMNSIFYHANFKSVVYFIEFQPTILIFAAADPNFIEAINPTMKDLL